MQVQDLKEKLEVFSNPSKYFDEETIVVRVHRPFPTVGGTPYVEVKGVGSGIDRDNGKFFIYPEEELCFKKDYSDEEIKKYVQKIDGLVWENSCLKREIKNLKNKLKEL